jgi:predicted GNAT superfamily acetyltransferase
LNGADVNAIDKVNKSIELRSATDDDFLDMLRLNKESVQYLSPLDKNRLEKLHKEASLSMVATLNGSIVAFCLGFREGADYDSLNYLWFSKRYEKFLYIDRVVVDINYQASGIGHLIYKEVFSLAEKNEVPLVTAEIDIEPPNPVSLRFHKKFGFSEVGRQEVAGGTKIVSLQTSSPI